jgi:hypothetical protein
MVDGAHVEIVDPKARGGVLAPSRVLINGVDVGLVSSDGVQINVGDSRNITTVTLTLLPSRVTIRSGDSEPAPSGAATLREALRKAAHALAFSFGGVRPDQCDSPEDRAMCEAMHVAFRALGNDGDAPTAGA